MNVEIPELNQILDRLDVLEAAVRAVERPVPWPRLLNRVSAIAWSGLSAKEFDRLRKDRRITPIEQTDGGTKFDRHEIAALIDELRDRAAAKTAHPTLRAVT